MSSGYRNPPAATRFKEGRPGNRKGRPKKAQRPVSVGYLFRKVAREQVPIEADGKRITMSHFEAFVEQIYIMALSKNNGAARLLDQLRRQFPGEALPGDPVTYLISKGDAKL
jgi:Family of unknown function (DUF5681)